MQGYVNVNFFWGGEIIREDQNIYYSVDPKQMQYVKLGTSYEELKDMVYGMMQISRYHGDLKMNFKYPQLGRGNVVQSFYLANLNSDADVTRMLSIPRTMQMGFGDVSLYIEVKKLAVDDPYSFQQEFGTQSTQTTYEPEGRPNQYPQYGTSLWSDYYYGGDNNINLADDHITGGSQSMQGYGGNQSFQGYGGEGSQTFHDYGGGVGQGYNVEEFSPPLTLTLHNSAKRLALEENETYDNDISQEDFELSPRSENSNDFQNVGESSEEDDDDEVGRSLVPLRKHHVPMVPWFETEEYTPFEMTNEGGYLDLVSHDVQLEVNTQFRDKTALQNAIRHYHIQGNRTYHVVRSNPTQLIVQCPKEGCAWRLRATYKVSCGLWEITVNDHPHNCLVLQPMQDHKKISSRLISSIVTPHVIERPQIRIASIITMVNTAYQHQVNYHKAWRGKQLAIEGVYGNWEKTYEVLPMFLTAMVKANPGSVAIIDAVPLRSQIRTSTCKRIFWCLKAMMDGWQHARPVISIDATYLRGKYEGKLLIAMGVDSNNHQYPLCYGLVDEESHQNWSWFLSKLREYVCRSRMGVCIISDRAKGISAAMNDPRSGFCEPWGFHKYCLLHVRSNFCDKNPGGELKRLMYLAGITPQIRKHEAYMKEIGDISPEALVWLRTIDPTKWTLAHDEGHRYGQASTNIVEGYNGSIRMARHLPTTAMMEYLFYRAVKIVNTNRNGVEESLQRGQDLCQRTLKMLVKIQKKASGHLVKPFHNQLGIFTVKTFMYPCKGGYKGDNVQNVNISNQTCTCGKWAMHRLPCSHVVAACEKINVDWKQWIGPYHYNLKLQELWRPIIYPLEPNEYWNYDLPREWQDYGKLVPDENTRKTKGKRGDKGKSVRIRTEMDRSHNGKRCSVCKQEGHTKRSKKCPQRQK